MLRVFARRGPQTLLHGRRLSGLRTVRRTNKFFPRVNAVRPYSTGLLPRGLFIRTFWTGVTALTGYTYYQLTQATGWLSDQLDLLGELGVEGLLHALEAWEGATQMVDGLAAHWWNPFAWRLKANGTPS